MATYIKSNANANTGAETSALSDWFSKSSNQSTVSGGFSLAGGLLSSFSEYKQAKENYNTSLKNASEIRAYADDVAEDMRKEQWYREGQNLTSISTSGFATGSFVDLLREDYTETDVAARKQRDQLYAQAKEMEKKAKKARDKARSKKKLGTAIAGVSAVLAPFTGGASLAVGGAAMGALNSYY